MLSQNTQHGMVTRMKTDDEVRCGACGHLISQPEADSCPNCDTVFPGPGLAECATVEDPDETQWPAMMNQWPLWEVHLTGEASEANGFPRTLEVFAPNPRIARGMALQVAAVKWTGVKLLAISATPKLGDK